MTKLQSVRSQRGMVTAEYAVGVIAACSVAGLCLYPIFGSPWMRGLLVSLVRGLVAPWL